MIAFSIFGSCRVMGQIPVNSPYTRFGLGDIVQNGFELSRALGGAAAGIRSNNQINFVNPASYSAQDTLSLIFDFGLVGSIRKLNTEFSETSYKELNIGHIAISFPVTRWWGAAIGITPYSKVGYNIVFNGTFTGSSDAYEVYHKGRGGLNQFFIGSGFRIGRNISVGANLSYLFGSVVRSRTVSIIDNSSGSFEAGTAQTVFRNEMVLKNVLFTFGIQGFTNIGENHKITAGLILDNKTNLNGTLNEQLFADYVIPSDTVRNFVDGSIEIPARIGFGASYSYKNKLLVAADFYSQDWSKSEFFNRKDSVTSSSSFRFGLQYTPVALTEIKRAPYWQRINLRAGAYYNNSYLKINGVQLIDYGMTFGIGIPWKNEKNLLTNSSFNLTYQFGRRGSFKNGLVKETYHIFSLGFTLYDFWFIKPKYD